MKQLARIVFLIGCGLAAAAFVFAEAWPATHVDDLAGKPRVVILSDIGNEPDDQMRLCGCCFIRTNLTWKP